MKELPLQAASHIWAVVFPQAPAVPEQPGSSSEGTGGDPSLPSKWSSTEGCSAEGQGLAAGGGGSAGTWVWLLGRDNDPALVTGATPCVLWGSGVTLIRSIQSGTLGTLVWSSYTHYPDSFLVCIPSPLQLTACNKISKTAMTKNLKLKKNYCLMELHLKVTFAQLLSNNSLLITFLCTTLRCRVVIQK